MEVVASPPTEQSAWEAESAVVQPQSCSREAVQPAAEEVPAVAVGVNASSTAEVQEATAAEYTGGAWRVRRQKRNSVNA